MINTRKETINRKQLKACALINNNTNSQKNKNWSSKKKEETTDNREKQAKVRTKKKS